MKGSKLAILRVVLNRRIAVPAAQSIDSYVFAKPAARATVDLQSAKGAQGSPLIDIHRSSTRKHPAAAPCASEDIEKVNGCTKKALKKRVRAVMYRYRMVVAAASRVD